MEELINPLIIFHSILNQLEDQNLIAEFVSVDERIIDKKHYFIAYIRTNNSIGCQYNRGKIRMRRIVIVNQRMRATNND